MGHATVEPKRPFRSPFVAALSIVTRPPPLFFTAEGTCHVSLPHASSSCALTCVSSSAPSSVSEASRSAPRGPPKSAE
eukprot:2985799-Pleurochrysis_carterae.AAC.1